eukprot:153218-Hanusia_phi.AAC.1
MCKCILLSSGWGTLYPQKVTLGLTRGVSLDKGRKVRRSLPGDDDAEGVTQCVVLVSHHKCRAGRGGLRSLAEDEVRKKSEIQETGKEGNEG